MEQKPMNSGEILLYSDGSGKEFVNAVFKDEAFWITQKAMAAQALRSSAKNGTRSLSPSLAARRPGP